MTQPTSRPIDQPEKKRLSLAEAIDLQAESRKALGALLDKIALIVLTLGTVGTAASVLRVLTTGWHVNVVLDIVFFAAIAGVVLLRRMIPTHTAFGIIVGLVVVSALANFMTLGVITVSFTILAACCVVTGIAFGVRAAVWLLAATAAAVLALAAGFATGLLPRPELSSDYLHSPLTWLSQAAGFITYTGAMLVTIGSTHRRLERTLKRTAAQSEQLRTNEEHYRLLAENMRDVLFRQDMDLNTIYVSPAAERMFGYTYDECLRLTLPEILAPESLTRAREAFRAYAARAAAGEDVRVPPMELEYVRKDGSTFWAELRPAFLRDSNGNLIGSQGLVIDLTERKREETRRRELESRLRQSEKLEALGQLAGGVAHDFNNQLVGVMAYAQLLKEDRPGDELVAEYTDNILAPAHRAAELTRKLLAFARKGTYRRTTVDLHAIIDEVVAILRRSIDKSIRLVRHYEAASPVISGDATQLQSALLNVGLNARDAMPDGGEILFATRTVDTPPSMRSSRTAPPSRCLEVAVTDTGIGMSAEVAGRIFEPFYTTKEPGQGTGMGLAAVHGTVEAHDGSIAVESAPGVGSTFTMLFPLVEQHAAPDLEAARPRQPERGQGRVLLVDDEDTVRAAVSQMLRRLGYEVRMYPSGCEAIAYYDAHADEVDLVLLDLILPEMRGTTVIERLRRIRTDVKVVVSSGYAADGDVHALESSGAAGFLRTPFTTEELSRVVAAALQTV